MPRIVTFSWTSRTRVLASGMEWDQELDAQGLLCPLPVLKARKRLLSLPVGGVLRVLADDPAAMIDFPHFCNEQGHLLLEIEEIAPPLHAFLVRKG